MGLWGGMRWIGGSIEWRAKWESLGGRGCACGGGRGGGIGPRLDVLVGVRRLKGAVGGRTLRADGGDVSVEV